MPVLIKNQTHIVAAICHSGEEAEKGSDCLSLLKNNVLQSYNMTCR